jgi:hypothetical protein
MQIASFHNANLDFFTSLLCANLQNERYRIQEAEERACLGWIEPPTKSGLVGFGHRRKYSVLAYEVLSNLCVDRERPVGFASGRYA